MKRYAKEGEAVRFPYMRTYRDFDADVVVAYPIFISQIVLVWRWIWIGLYKFNRFMRDKVERREHLAYRKGLEKGQLYGMYSGFEKGFEFGEAQGINSTYDFLMKSLESRGFKNT